MGMFDWIKCEMPLPDGFTGELQTKSLDCQMDTYAITKEGKLVRAEGGPALRTIIFYGSDAETGWHEYRAVLQGDQVISIEKVN